jgi:transcriptional regulator with XRE-family HTH domain
LRVQVDEHDARMIVMGPPQALLETGFRRARLEVWKHAGLQAVRASRILEQLRVIDIAGAQVQVHAVMQALRVAVVQDAHLHRRDTRAVLLDALLVVGDMLRLQHLQLDELEDRKSVPRRPIDVQYLRIMRGRRAYVRPQRTAEALLFSQALQHLRDEMKWNQNQLGAHLGVSVRTLTNWECGYWLPHYRQRLHVVLSLRHVPAEHVLAVADALGVSGDEAVAPFLQQFKDALDPPEVETAAERPPPAPLPPPAPPPPPRPSLGELRAVVDPIVLDAANALDARPNDVRAIVAKVIAACGGLGGTLQDVAGAVAPVVAKAKSA